MWIYAETYAGITPDFLANNDMQSIIELSEEQRRRVAEIDSNLAACRSALEKYDRGVRREQLDSLQSRTEDLSDIPKALAAAEEWGKARAAEPRHEEESGQVQAAISSIREKLREQMREFVKPVAEKAASVARQTAAKFEADEKQEAEESGFPFVASGKVVGLRESAKGFENLAKDPGGSVPYDNFSDWLANLRIS